MRKIMIFIILVLIVCIGVGVYADTTSDDPIISLSYLNKRLEESKEDMVELINKKIKGINNVIESENSKYKIVELKKGDKVIFGESTEFILRRGEAKIIDPSKSNGIPNITLGKDEADNSKIGLQQLYLIPRDDGRGILASSDIILMVRGSYIIE